MGLEMEWTWTDADGRRWRPAAVWGEDGRSCTFTWMPLDPRTEYPSGYPVPEPGIDWDAALAPVFDPPEE